MNEAGFRTDARQVLSAYGDRCTRGSSILKANADTLLTLLRLVSSPNTKIARNSALLLQAFCNQPAVQALVGELENNLEYNSLSEIGTNFLSTCEKNGSIAMYTAQAFYRLSDYAMALTTINQVPKMTSEYTDAASWQGFILEKLNRHAEAAAAFEKALYIYIDLKTVSPTQFFYITRALKVAGQYCKAVHPLELYLSFDPERRRTEEIDKLIAELKALGRCAPDVAAGAVVVRLRSDGGVYLVDATIDGMTGTFILDTGASTVHLTKSFSSKLGIALDNQNMVTIQGVTGTRKDYLAQVKRVDVGSAQANDVTVTIASDDSSFGRGIDGLLGQSVLSRFKVSVDATSRTLSLEQRK
jgi:clan AA aspartic protease (TIGR02281 family)